MDDVSMIDIQVDKGRCPYIQEQKQEEKKEPDAKSMIEIGKRYLDIEQNINLSMKYLMQSFSNGDESSINYIIRNYIIIGTKEAIKTIIEICNRNNELLLKIVDCLQNLLFIRYSTQKITEHERRIGMTDVSYYNEAIIFIICFISEILTNIYNELNNNNFNITDNNPKSTNNKKLIVKIFGYINYNNLRKPIFIEKEEYYPYERLRNPYFKIILHEQYKKLKKYVDNHVKNIMICISEFLYNNRYSEINKLTYGIMDSLLQDDRSSIKYVHKADEYLRYLKYWYQNYIKKKYKPGGDGYILAKNEFESISKLQSESKNKK
jgi:hypothetical protein